MKRNVNRNMLLVMIKEEIKINENQCEKKKVLAAIKKVKHEGIRC